jgi:hypothetical protein
VFQKEKICLVPVLQKLEFQYQTLKTNQKHPDPTKDTPIFHWPRFCDKKNKLKTLKKNKQVLAHRRFFFLSSSPTNSRWSWAISVPCARVLERLRLRLQTSAPTKIFIFSCPKVTGK